jgi:hypothetical protein
LTKFRKGQFGETPYLEIPLGLAKPESSPLRRIVVGPSSHKDDIKSRAVRDAAAKGAGVVQWARQQAEDAIETGKTAYSKAAAAVE